MELDAGTLNRSGIFTFAVDILVNDELRDGGPIGFGKRVPIDPRLPINDFDITAEILESDFSDLTEYL
jgi:hypothetical protein